ncbi:caspase family protein [Streptomyces sp. NBC_00322]|uniref:hypothetical protein n=1 Tax=Streptomyces sp. NBC_00322 TaxID=2975712 RepID=UPI002E28CBC4|nr:hypothetical protein [Streptomyces sp. NBC_00322]
MTTENDHAVVVGLEQYGVWQLPGPAADALRFTRWLRRRRVPAKNIQLWLAPLSGDGLRAQAQALGVRYNEAVSRDQLMDVFRDGPRPGGDGGTLYVFWGGHGVMARNDQRLLYCPNSTWEDRRCLNFTNLREYLTRHELTGFRRQVFLVDSCATYYERLNSGDPDPAVAYFPEPQRIPGVEQFMLYATRAGEAADNPGEGLFSQAVLDHLEAAATDPARDVDLAALTGHLAAHFRQLAIGKPSVALPTAVHVRHLSGDEEQLHRAALPAPPATPDFRDFALTVRTAFADVGELARHAQHLAAECPASGVQGQASADEVACALYTHPRAMAAFTESLHRAGSPYANQIRELGATRNLPGLLSPMEYERLLQILRGLPELSGPQVLACLQAALPWVILPDLPAEEDSYQRLVAWVRELEKRRLGKYPPLVHFTEFLAALVPESDAEALRAWGLETVLRVGGSAEVAASWRDEARQWAATRPALGRGRVVVQLDAGAGADWDDAATYTCAVWSDIGDGQLVPGSSSGGGGHTAAQVTRLVAEAVDTLGATSPVVEILVPLEGLAVPVDTWHCTVPGRRAPKLLAVDHPVVLRCAAAAGSYRGRRLAPGAPVVLTDLHRDGWAAHGALQADQARGLALITAEKPYRFDMAWLAVELGYRVVLWERELPGPLGEDFFHPLFPRGAALGALPDRIRAYRAKALVDPAACPGRLSLVYDDPSLPLPAVLPLTQEITADEQQRECGLAHLPEPERSTDHLPRTAPVAPVRDRPPLTGSV